MTCGNTGDLVDHPLPKYFLSAHGASHHAWAPDPHHLNPTLVLPVNKLVHLPPY